MCASVTVDESGLVVTYTGRLRPRKTTVEEANPSLQRSAKKVKKVREKTRPSKDGLVECSECNAKVRKRNLARHLERVHQSKELIDQETKSSKSENREASQPLSNETNIIQSRKEAASRHKEAILREIAHTRERVVGSKKGKPLVQCHLCQKRLLSSQFTEHLISIHRSYLEGWDHLSTYPQQRLAPEPSLHDVHNTEAGRLSSSKPVEVSSSSKKMVRCPYCACSVREDRLNKHCHKVHNISHESRNHNVSRQARQSRTEKPESLEQAYLETRDGGKYLGYMARENGRFGSLPLYDDYGDESEAE